MDMAPKLNPKHSIFVAEYLANGRNGTQAALKAGYGNKQKSKKSQLKVAGVASARLIAKDSIQKEITRRTQAQLNKSELTAQMVLDEIRKLAFVDVSQAFNEDGTLKKFSEMPEDVRKSIIGCESAELHAGRGAFKKKIGHLRKTKHTDKTRMLEMLAKHFKLLTDVTELANHNNEPLVVFNTPSNGSEAEDEKK